MVISLAAGPYAPNPSLIPNETDCSATEGEGLCYFVDSQASNNWIALRVRNATHNFQYAESFGSLAMHTPTPGDPNGIGIFKCLPGDDCQLELVSACLSGTGTPMEVKRHRMLDTMCVCFVQYDYGPIVSDYPNFPVKDERRWNLHNLYKDATPATQDALHQELKAAYCSSRRLDADRMECGTEWDSTRPR